MQSLGLRWRRVKARKNAEKIREKREDNGKEFMRDTLRQLQFFKQQNAARMVDRGWWEASEDDSL